MEKELWKKIEEAPDTYVSNLGNVKQYGKLIPIKYYKNQKYGRVILSHSSNCHGFLIHRLVAKYFVSNEDNKSCIHHIDHDTHNNKASNLRWVTYKENVYYNKLEGTLNTEDARKSLVKKHHTGVIMCDKDTHKELKYFKTTKEAAEYCSVIPTGITSVINHTKSIVNGKVYYRKSCGGYYWKAVNPKELGSTRKQIIGVKFPNGNWSFYPSIRECCKRVGIDFRTLKRRMKNHSTKYKDYLIEF